MKESSSPDYKLNSIIKEEKLITYSNSRTHTYIKMKNGTNK